MDLIKNIISMNNNLDSLDEDGNNIIHKLVENNDSKILKEGLETLIEKGELKKLINQKNYTGYTPLHCAITNHNQSCAQILINNGADTRIPTDDGYRVKWAEERKQKGGGAKKIVGRRFL
jgi:hypothetical protein